MVKKELTYIDSKYRMKQNAQAKKGDQTIDHLLSHCTLLQQQREILRNGVIKHGKWPVSKNELIKEHPKAFIKFTESIDFEHL
jgi:hypothetical protein